MIRLMTRKVLMKLREHWLFALTCVLFLLIKLCFVGYRFSDDGIWFYMGKLILNGEFPYKDFYVASPPLQVLLIALIEAFINTNFLLLKTIPWAATLITGTLIYALTQKRYGKKAAWLVSVLYLFSFLVLTTSDHVTGVHLTTTLITTSFYFVKKERLGWAGFFTSLALLTRLYSLIPALGILAYLLLKKKRWVSYAVLSAGVFIISCVVLDFLSSGEFFRQVFLFRMNLTSIPGIPKTRILLFFLTHDHFLLVLSMLSVLSCSREKKCLLEIIIILFLCVFYVFYADVYYLYLGLIMPFLCLITASIIKKVMRVKWFKHALTGAVIGFALLNSALYASEFADKARIHFIDELVSFVKNNSSPNETLYGSFEITPLIALLTNRRISHNIVDTNDKNFMTGFINKELLGLTKPFMKAYVNKSYATELVKRDVKFVFTKALIIDGTSLMSEEFIDEDLLHTCEVVKTYYFNNDYSSNALLVWDCSTHQTEES